MAGEVKSPREMEPVGGVAVVPGPRGAAGPGFLGYLCSRVECGKSLSVKPAFLNFIPVSDFFFNLGFKYAANHVDFKI